MPETLFPSQICSDCRVWTARLTPQCSSYKAADHRHSSRVLSRAPCGPREQVGESIAHVMRCHSLAEPDVSGGAVTGTLGAVVSERQVHQGSGAPAANLGCRVDLVPALALLERQHLLKAAPSVCPRGSPHV